MVLYLTNLGDSFVTIKKKNEEQLGFILDKYRLNVEEKNFDLIKYLSEENKKILIDSSNKNKLGAVSISRSLFPEGRVMSSADKKVAFNQIKDFGSACALITGYNKNLGNKTK